MDHIEITMFHVASNFSSPSQQLEIHALADTLEGTVDKESTTVKSKKL
jgi:hypothetical protein